MDIRRFDGSLGPAVPARAFVTLTIVEAGYEDCSGDFPLEKVQHAFAVISGLLSPQQKLVAA